MLNSLRRLLPGGKVQATTYSSEPLILEYDGESMRLLAGKAAITTSGAEWRGNGRRGFREIPNTERGYAQAYMAVDALQRAADIRANKVAEVMGRGRVVSKKSGEEIPDHPFTDALERSRRAFRHDIYRRWEYWRILTGEAYLEPVKGNVPGFANVRMMFGFRVLNSLVTEPLTATGALTGFLYAGADRMVTFQPDELVYDYTFNPFDDNRGKSMLSAVLDEMNINRGVLVASRNYIKNGMHQRVIFMAKNSAISEPEFDRLLSDIGKQAGPDKAGKPLILTQPLETAILAPPPPTEQREYKRVAQQAASTATGVPLPLIVYEQNPYQLSQEQRMAWYDLSLIPEARDMAVVVNTHLLPYFDSNEDHEFVIPADEIRADLMDAKDKAEMVKLRLHGGWLTFNQALQADGREPIDGGDFYLFPSGMTAIPADKLSEITDLTAPKPSQMQITQQGAQQPAGQGQSPVEPPPEPRQLPAPAQRSYTPPAKASSTGTPEAYAILDLSDNEQLVAFQNKLRDAMPDVDGIRWANRSTFHITVFYATLISDEQLERVMAGAIADDLAQGMTLTVGPLTTFEVDGAQKPLIMPVAVAPELEALQRSMVQRLHNLGVPISEYSEPENYHPHITMAYIASDIEVPDIEDIFTVSPDSVTFSRGDHYSVGTLPLSEPEDLSVIPLALDELKAWQRYHRNGTGQKRAFKALMVREDIADTLRAALDAAGTDKVAINQAFQAAFDAAAVKAIQSTRLDFEGEFETLLKAARSEDIDRRQWSGRLRTLLRKYGELAFRDGLNDGGVVIEPDEKLSDEDAATVAIMLAEQSQYVTNFGEKLFKQDGITDPMADNKPSVWFNGSVMPLYHAGLESADKNAMMEIVGPVDEHSCGTCSTAAGQRHRYKDWARHDLLFPYGGAIECGDGKQCRHKMVRTNARARGRLDRIPKRVYEVV